MKKILFGTVLLLLVGAGTMRADPRQLKLFVSPTSNIPSADILKNLGEKCPNVSITLDSKKSDYMLEARWVGRFEFTVFRHGGEAAYATQTSFLHNAVKDVCHYVNSQKE
jgi:hypothetical protein